MTHPFRNSFERICSKILLLTLVILPLSAFAQLDTNTFGSPINLVGGSVNGGRVARGDLAVGDLDGDGKPDLVTVSYNGISIWKNNSTPGTLTASSFPSHIDFDVGPGTTMVVISDLDRDGKPDIITTCNNGNSGNFISIFKNTAAPGTFNSSSLASRVDIPDSSFPYSIATGDLDGDGKIDIAITHFITVAADVAGNVSIFRNTGTSGILTSNTFGSPVPFATGNRPGRVAIGDLNSDGKPELVVVTQGVVVNNIGSNVSIFGNNCMKGVFDNNSFNKKIDFPTPPLTSDVAIEDIDGDGKLDIVTLSFLTISTFRNKSTGGSITINSFDIRNDISTGQNANLMALGDLDGDGKMDVAVGGDFGTQRLSLFRNTSSSGSISFTPSIPTGNNAASIVVIDLDGDGNLDLATPNSVLRNQAATPIITFSPASGSVGTPVTITSPNFSVLGSRTVRFDNTSIITDSNSPTIINTTVPAGATTGKITILNNAGIAHSATQFVVLPFKISSFSPSASIGSSLTISGSGFSHIPSNNIVKFNGVIATVLESAPASLKVIVPPGATNGKITVTVEGQTAISDTDFTLTLLSILEKNSEPYFSVGDLVTPVSITVNDISLAQSAKFFSRGISSNESGFTSIDLGLSTSSNIISFSIPSTYFTDQIGLQFYFSLTDKNGNVIVLEKQHIYLKYLISSSDPLIPDLIFGKTSDKYQLISVPLKLKNNDAKDVFRQLGTYDTKRWRLYSLGTTLNIQYSDFGFPIDIGKGYWLIVKDPISINPGEGTTTEVTEASPHVITLSSGWNLIGNPYNFAISWKDVLAYNDNPTGVGNLRSYKSGTFSEIDVLDRYRGAFVRLDGIDAIDLKIPFTNKGLSGGRMNTSEDISQNPIDAKQWEVKLKIEDGVWKNDLGGIGMHQQAKDGADHWDELKLPAPEGVSSFELVMKELKDVTLVKDVVLTSDTHSWSGEISSSNGVTLSWDNTHFGGNEKQLVFESLDWVYLTDMRKVSTTKLPSGVQRFKIHFGSEEYIKSATLSDEPRVSELFPNPLKNNQSLKIYVSLPTGVNDVRMVMRDLTRGSSLLSGIGQYDEGRKVVEWNADFSRVSAGLYLVNITVQNHAGTYTFYRKVIVE